VGLGTALTWVAMTLGASVAFSLARAGRTSRFGGRLLARATARLRARALARAATRVGPWVVRLDRHLERRGLLSLLYTRLVPGMPFSSVNYAAGLTGIGTRDYLIATAVGIIPSSYLLVALGGSIAHPTSPRFIATLAATVGLAAAATVADAVLRRRRLGVLGLDRRRADSGRRVATATVSPETTVQRRSVEVDATTISYLHAGVGSPVLLVHGTFWSRVWEPVLPALVAAGREAFAVDFPGFGHSGGRLDRDGAAVPALADWCLRFLDAVDCNASFAVAGHDIGGAVAQHLAATEDRVQRLALMNSVLYDSWPVPAVSRFRDPKTAAAVTVAELLDARRQSLAQAIARPLEAAERDAWLEPWRSEDRVRSWVAMAAAADCRYTLQLTGRLAERALPTMLIWGTEDSFQPIAFAERYVREIPHTRLAPVQGARHIPAHDDPDAVAHALTGFLSD
jgi:pimeloyl-ACP methyl ester carboxylesterase/uncharacterized membrane protein YdjX (TVP38/TMEM64 family)